MARSKNVPAPPLDDLPRLPSDDSPAVAETITETINEMSPSIDAPTTIDSLAPGAETLTEASPDLPSLLDRMKAAAEVAKQKVESDWNSLVLKLAIGAAVSEAEVIAIAQAASKTLDDLADAVNHERELASLRTQIAGYMAAENDCTVAHQAWVEFKKRREAIINELDAESKRLRQAEWMATRRRDRCRDARVKLEKLTGIITNYDRNGTAVPVTASAETVNASNPVTVA